jgi:sortase A
VHGTAAPGADGNCVIAGHRDTQFAFLEDVRVGDGIELESADGRTTCYRVVETAVVHEHDVAVLSDDGVAELTLLTCWPFDTLEVRGPWRFMARAAAVGSHAPANSSPISSPECSRSGSNRR